MSSILAKCSKSLEMAQNGIFLPNLSKFRPNKCLFHLVKCNGTEVDSYDNISRHLDSRGSALASKHFRTVKNSELNI